MKSPFPGMDPYLERHWRDVHASIVIYTRDQLQAQLPSELVARVEERVILESPEPWQRGVYPDVRVVEKGWANGGAPAIAGGVAVAEPLVVQMPDEPVTETYIEVIDAGTAGRIVTVIEILSLTNKRRGDERDRYLKKRSDLEKGGVSIVEIDLLRGGEPTIMVPDAWLPADYRTPYRVCVWRSWRPLCLEVYRVPLRDRLPTIRVPLREEDPDVALDLQAIIDQSYRNGGYIRTNYRVEPEPPLDPEDAVWADALLRSQGKR